MADRADIRDAFTSELQSLAGSYDVKDANGNIIDTVTLDSGDIGLREPEQTESLPAIVYHENYTRVFYNQVGRGPDVKTYDSNGNVTEIAWREYIDAQFIVDVRASNEVAKEPIYEALRRQFAEWQFGAWDVRNLHADIIDIDVLDASSLDVGDTEDVIRVDQLDVQITFFREYTYTTDTIQTVEHLIDANFDGTTDLTYTTT